MDYFSSRLQGAPVFPQNISGDNTDIVKAAGNRRGIAGPSRMVATPERISRADAR
jgi:hypothetical protein